MGQKQKKEMDKKLKAFKPLLPFNFQSIYLLEIECKLRLKSLAGKARSALQVKILLSGTWMCLGSLENWILPLFEFFWGAHSNFPGCKRPNGEEAQVADKLGYVVLP